VADEAPGRLGLGGPGPRGPRKAKFDFGWGSAADPTGGAYSAPPGPLLDLRGLLLREGTGGKRGGMRREGREENGGKRGGKREGRGGLSGNEAEDAFCLKSAPALVCADVTSSVLGFT